MNPLDDKAIIRDHIAGKLSELEEKMAMHIPPGGNWCNIPLDIPSARLSQIRKMSKERGMCRTTYYGRLNPQKPSYTVNTYFSKIGNGTFLHYDVNQNRLISQREAARLQSFPDYFIFEGSFSSKFKQIGNAVPPFLMYNIVKDKFSKCKALDLFCGAGGLSLGLEWAGIQTVCGVDIDKNAISTYKANFPTTEAIVGDLTDMTLKEHLISSYQDIDLICGGPPCQGFSQAGWFNCEDARNFLFKDFLEVIKEISPQHFIMENVQGILWIGHGSAINLIVDSFKKLGYEISLFTLSSEQYGIPQIRKRVFITGSLNEKCILSPPILCKNDSLDLHREITVEEAISDLPAIYKGSPASSSYAFPAQSPYQQFMRSEILCIDYYDIMAQGRNW